MTEELKKWLKVLLHLCDKTSLVRTSTLPGLVFPMWPPLLYLKYLMQESLMGFEPMID